MKEIGSVVIKAVSVIVLPPFMLGWALWGAYCGLVVWCWNFNNNKCGEWKFKKPEST